MSGELFRNIKTRDFYVVLHSAIDATNALGGRAVVVYREIGGDQVYVRDAGEFEVKFERVEAGK